jgi:hypothetical protein
MPEATPASFEAAYQPFQTVKEFHAGNAAFMNQMKPFIKGVPLGLGGHQVPTSQLLWFDLPRYKALVDSFSPVINTDWRAGEGGIHEAKRACCIQVSMEAGGAHAWDAVRQAHDWLLIFQPYFLNDPYPLVYGHELASWAHRLSMWDFAGDAAGIFTATSLENLIERWNKIPLRFGNIAGTKWFDHKFETLEEFIEFYNTQSRQRWGRVRPRLILLGDDSVKLVLEYRDYCTPPSVEMQTAIVALHHAIHMVSLSRMLPSIPGGLAASHWFAGLHLAMINPSGFCPEADDEMHQWIAAKFAEINARYGQLGYDNSWLEPCKRYIVNRRSPAMEAADLFKQGGAAAVIEARRLWW